MYLAILLVSYIYDISRVQKNLNDVILSKKLEKVTSMEKSKKIKLPMSQQKLIGNELSQEKENKVENKIAVENGEILYSEGSDEELPLQTLNNDEVLK